MVSQSMCESTGVPAQQRAPKPDEEFEMPKRKGREGAGSGGGGRRGHLPAEVEGDEVWDDALVTVTTADGTLVDGYAIAPDAVLVKEAELELPLAVTVDDERVDVVRIIESHGPEPTEEWLALQLPPRSIPGDRILPMPPPDDEDGALHARGGKSVWCMVFKLKGC